MGIAIYNPSPVDTPIVYPRTIPKVVVPSYIGEPNQILNLLVHEGAGDIVKDYSGKGYHGKINGAKWTDKYSASWALDFDGDDDWLDCGPDVTDNLTSFTLIYWIMADSWTGGYNAGCRTEYQIYHRFWSTSAGDRGIWIGDGSDWVDSVTDTTEPSFGTWYMCTFRWDGSTMELLYNNANLQLSVDTTITSTGSNSHVLGFASHPDTGTEYLDGREANILLYTTALSDDEIKAHYDALKPLFVD